MELENSEAQLIDNARAAQVAVQPVAVKHQITVYLVLKALYYMKTNVSKTALQELTLMLVYAKPVLQDVHNAKMELNVHLAQPMLS